MGVLVITLLYGMQFRVMFFIYIVLYIDNELFDVDQDSLFPIKQHH